MRTIIVNASPKGNSKNSNSKIICEEFVRNMQSPCEIANIAGSDPEELADLIGNYDSVIFVLPLYVHAMPGIMMNLIEHLKPSPVPGRLLGFIIQAGFIETSQQKYVERYFSSLAGQLGYKYLGTVRKGEAAAIYMYPGMFKKVLRRFNDLGATYEATHEFDGKIAEALAKPYELTKFQSNLCEFFCNIGLNNIGWHRTLKRNNAFDKRLDRPYL